MIQRRTKQLPQEIARPIRWKGILLTMLGSLLILLFTNIAAIWYLPEYGTNWGNRLVAHKWEMLLNMKEPVDWLILGDSSGATAVVPSIINQRLGGTSVNLCTHAGLRIINDAWMLDTYIEQLGPPKNVLLVHTVNVWAFIEEPELYNLLQIPLGWGFWSLLQPPVELSPRQVFNAFLIRYVPLYSQSTTLGSILKTPWTTPVQLAYLSFQDDGWLLLPESNPFIALRPVYRVIYAVKGKEASLHGKTINALEHIAALAVEYDFDVYLVTGPLLEDLYQNQDYLAYANQVRDRLDKFTANHERVRYVFRTPMTFPIDLMWGVNHMIGSAAPLYTEGLVSEIIHYGQTSISYGD